MRSQPHMGRPPCPSGFMCRSRAQELCLERFSGHGVGGGAEAITNGSAALQVCSTQSCAVPYQPVVSGGRACALLACVRAHKACSVTTLSVYASRRLLRHYTWNAHALVLLLTAAVGINGDITETAAGAEDHVLRGGGSAQAATWRVCRTGASTHFASTWRAPGAAVRRMSALDRLVACISDMPG